MLPLGVGGAFYINLEHRTDRRAEFEEEAAAMGLSCERFPAIYNKSGTVGCGQSHLAVLKEAQARGYESVLIFEDDFKFIVDKETFWTTMSQIQTDISGSYDVIMLGYNILKSSAHSKNLLKVLSAQTTSAYIVHSRIYSKLINTYEVGLHKLIETGQHWNYSVDQYWKVLQPDTQWFAAQPRLGLQRPSFSDVGQKFTDNKC